ncbi:hypothetical protein ACFPM7_10370 [Actinokineospora guangxiensis]|uniref:Uncharacterized protein n=1 Tax=Actinokineospora guangxiensis TaxID=1490288 RepID=A0ABW0EJ86_9PSEU
MAEPPEPPGPTALPGPDAAIAAWLSATEDSTALGHAADAHERMRRVWAAELAASRELP